MINAYPRKQLLAAAIVTPLGIAAVTASAADPWAFSFGSAGQEYGKALATDPSGNLIVAGLYQNTVDFDPGAGTTTLGAGQSGVKTVIAKYAPDGTIAWARSLAGAAPTQTTVVTPHGVQTDSAGNVYVSGYFGTTNTTGTNAVQATADFDPGPGVATLTNSGERDPFIAKYDANGNYLWARTLGNTTYANTNLEERVWDMAVDASGGVYAVGMVHGTYKLNAASSTSNTYTSAGRSDAFLVKYDTSGNYAWGMGLGGAGDDTALSVAVDANNHVFLSGHFSGTIDADPGAGTSNLTSAGFTDLFFARYDATSGQHQTSVRVGGTLSETAPPGALRTDAAGNVYLTGRFRGAVDIDPGAAVATVSNVGAGASDEIFVESLTNDLEYRWGFNIASDGGLDGAHRVLVDSNGNVVVAGWFQGSADFDGSDAAATLTSNATDASSSDVFLAKYDGSGNYLWAHNFGAETALADQGSIAAGLALGPGDVIYLSGQYYGVADFDPSSGEALLTEVGTNDIFLAKFNPDGTLAVVPEPGAAGIILASIAAGLLKRRQR